MIWLLVGKLAVDASSKTRTVFVRPLLPPEPDMSSTLAPVGPTNRNLAFPGVGTLIPNRLTDTFCTVPMSPLTLLVEPYGDAGPLALTVMALGLGNNGLPGAWMKRLNVDVPLRVPSLAVMVTLTLPLMAPTGNKVRV